MTLDRWPASRFALRRFFQGKLFLRGLRLGDPEARGTILYIHGLGESALCFEALVSDPRLAGWAHLAPDLLGYGRSTWPARPRSVTDHADDLAELIRGCPELVAAGDRLVLLGHSMGGVIGLELIRRLGRRRVACFLNVEGNVTLDDCGFSSRAAGHSESDWLEGGGYARFVDAVFTLSDGTPATESAAVARAYGASVLFADPRTLLLNSEDLVRESRAETLAGRYAEAGVPTVYLHGRPRGTGERSLGQLAAAGLAETRGFAPAGHWPFLDQHDAFARAVAEILDGASA
ncbi:MAG: alpha/beta hydrolase [Acidobacteriota bacterium]